MDSDIKLLPKYCESTREAFARMDSQKSVPFAELFAFETDPEYLAKIKYYYLDYIEVHTAEGVDCKITLLSEEELSKKKTKKPKVPTVPKADYDRILAELHKVRLELAQARKTGAPDPAPVVFKPTPATAVNRPIVPKPVITAYRTEFVKAGKNFVPVRVPINTISA